MNRSFALLALLASSVSLACSASDGKGAPSFPVGSAGSAATAGQAVPVAGSDGGAATAGTAGTSIAGSDVGGAGGVSGGGDGMAGASVTTMGGALADDPGSDGDGSFMIAGPWKSAPEFSRGAGVPQGKTFTFTYAAKTSTIYPKAIDRKVTVYVPTQYKTGTLAAVMVVQDGTDFYGFDGSMPPVFDNLIAKGSIPPVVCVFVGNGGGDSVGSERGLEYDTVSGLYAKWLDSELLPAVEAQSKTSLAAQAITFTHNPEGRATFGGSSGGAASFSAAWWRPDLFRRVMTWSGTYVTQVPSSSPFKNGAWIYHDIDPYQAAAPNGLIMASCQKATDPQYSSDVQPCDTPTTKATCEAAAGCAWNDTTDRPIRVWHEAGTNDDGAGNGPGGHRDFMLANQRMAASFQARKYHYHFDLAAGAGHVDMGPLRQTLPAGMIWLWRGYKAGT
ncbi:MAG TPA: alpha/beta hydrolase-fold protein [Polyangiaceae bacterium]